MNVSAPNCSAAGSHNRVTKKYSPNLCRESADSCQSVKISRTVIRTTEPANKNVISRAISSPSRSLLRNEREPDIGPALGTVVVAAISPYAAWLLNLGQRFFFLGDYFLRQLRVRQLLHVVLPVLQHPAHKALDRIP